MLTVCFTLVCWFHVGAVSFDAITTRHATAMGWHEIDPLTRPFVGAHPTYARMIPFGTAEVLGAGWLAKKNKKLRWLEIGLTAVHVGAGVRNYSLSRRAHR